MIGYLLERTEPCEGGELRAEMFYADYSEWCVRNGSTALARATFLQAFDRARREHGVAGIEKSGACYSGIQLAA